MTAKNWFWQWYWAQNWIPLRFKKTAHKQLAKSGQAASAAFDVDFFGLRYQGNLDNGIEFAIFYYGAFEKPLLFFLRDCLHGLSSTQPGNTVFCDIGANIGQHSLFMSRFAGSVHAFEPLATVSEKLEQHIALNQINNIQLHKLGLSDSNGSLPFYAPSGANMGVGSFAEQSQDKGNKAIGELAIARADDYFPSAGIERIDLVKIDVEGFERKALAGLSHTLEKQRPVLVCEVSYGDALSFHSEADLLASLPQNYRLYRFDTRKADGSTARRRGAREKRSGAYKLVPVTGWRERDQDDLVAIPAEKLDKIPLQSA